MLCTSLHVLLNCVSRYECIVPGEADLVVEYKGKLFCFESEEKLQKFMRCVFISERSGSPIPGVCAVT